MINKNINWMILGKSGNGKSSLLNYLFGTKLKTGTGKPVTKYGEFNKIVHTSPLKKDVTYTLYDSWGLESNKSNDWKNIVYNKLNSKFNIRGNDLFLGIMYCLSFNNRIEDFEITIIKELITKLGYNVIIILTNADIGDYRIKKSEYIKYLNDKLGSDNKEHYCILDACSISGKKVDGTQFKQFGKENILKQIEEYGERNLISIITKKVERWRDESIENCNKYARTLKREKIDDSYCKNTLVNIDKEVINDLTELFRDCTKKIKGLFKYTAQWYKYIKGSAYEGKRLEAFDFWKVIPINLGKYIIKDRYQNQEKYSKVFENRIFEFNKQIEKIHDDVIENIKKQNSNRNK